MTALIPLTDLLDQVRACRVCDSQLPLGAKPVLRARQSARLLIVGQAPGTRVHESGIPWNDPSGDRLREWLGLSREQFYNEDEIAIVPMGFCYPGRGKSGDLPPRGECAPLWHAPLLASLPKLELMLLVGSYAQQYYLPGDYPSLAERVKDWRRLSRRRDKPVMVPLVHPSPRNRRWLKHNPWFEQELVPHLRRRVKNLLRSSR